MLTLAPLDTNPSLASSSHKVEYGISETWPINYLRDRDPPKSTLDFVMSIVRNDDAGIRRPRQPYLLLRGKWAKPIGQIFDFELAKRSLDRDQNALSAIGQVRNGTLEAVCFVSGRCFRDRQL